MANEPKEMMAKVTGMALNIKTALSTVMSVEEFVCRGQKINVIKEYRHRTGVGLKESKDAVELWALKYMGWPVGMHWPEGGAR